ncbi:hypothetical protein L6Q96_20505 [Candidatus Binatia bacterium]|nr:hypothetical protein [Candidatus Binatia bacterium]
MKRKITILDEIHEYRERLAREHGYDLRRMAEALQQHEAMLRRKVVTLPPKRCEPVRKAS